MSLTGAERLSDGPSDPTPGRWSGQTVRMADHPVPDSPIPPPRDPGALAERVADADRDRTVTQLRENVVEGRLTLDEFSERVGSALQARTRGDLVAVMADLPQTRPAAETLPEAGTAPKKKRRWHVAVMSGHST